MLLTIILKVTISSIVANILAAVKLPSLSLVSATMKHVKPAAIAPIFAKPLSTLFPKDSFIKSLIS